METDPQKVASDAAETITRSVHDLTEVAADTVDDLRHNDTVIDIVNMITRFRQDHPRLAVAAAGLLAVTVLSVIIRCTRR